MELVELGALTEEDWAAVLDGEEEPFGPVGARLEWREKDRNVALRAADGTLVAFAGAVVVDLEVEGAPPFQVVGLGGLVVTRSQRGRGLMSRLLDALLRLAQTMGPDRAALFCRPDLVPVYRQLGFVEIDAPVFVDQPQGRVEMPLTAMWLPLREGARWPAGRVDVRGLPF